MKMKIVTATYSLYASAVKLILPKGRMWRADGDTWLGKLVNSISYELARFHNRIISFFSETDCQTADETIDDWEAMYGLPESDGAAPALLADRQVALTAKVRAKGGQSKAYFERVLAGLGVTVEVTEYAYTPAICGIAVCGYSAVGDVSSMFYWMITGSVPSEQRGQVEAIINRYKPAHTHVIFNYI